MSSSDYSSLKVVELKKELKNRGLSTAGNKDELVERLNTHTHNLLGPGSELDGFSESINENDILDEGVLGEDLDYEEDLKKSTDLEFSSAHDTLPGDTSIDSNASALDITTINVGDAEALPQRLTKEPKTDKKVHLVRNRSLSLLSDLDSKEEDKLTNDDSIRRKSSENSDLNKIVLKTNIPSSDKRRIELRKRKFGIISEDDKKASRAARFGLSSSTNSKVQKPNGNAKIQPVEESIDVLKQRAERFGTSIAPALQKDKAIEKLKSRAERFGTVVSPLLNKLTEQEKREARKNRFISSSATEEASLEEKKRIRAAKFNISV